MSRRGLLLVIDYHIDRQKHLRGGKADPYGSASLSLEAPEVPDDIRQKLKWEREYLGAYVSDDPLDYVAATDVAAEVGDTLLAGRVEITGVVLDLAVKRARSGVDWARFALLDRSGVARAFCFGHVALSLREGGVGHFRGELVNRDDETQVKVYTAQLMEQF